MLRNVIYTAALAAGLLVIALAPARPAAGQEYTFNNPMPREMLGMMYMDRPMRAISPYTVGPGHFQVEPYVFSYLLDDNSVETERTSIGNTLLRAGLMTDLEASVTVEPLIWQQIDNGVSSDDFGLGDTEVRLKYHVFGPNYPESALPVEEAAMAVSPFFTIPTNTHGLGLDRWSFGVDLPIFINLPGRFVFGLTPSLAYIPEGDQFGEEDDEYLRASNALAMFSPVFTDMYGFVEFFVRANTEEWSDWEGSADVGVIYAFTPDLYLHTAAYLGVTDEAPDMTFLFGFSWRY